jgi:hypothetical protein
VRIAELVGSGRLLPPAAQAQLLSPATQAFKPWTTQNW